MAFEVVKACRFSIILVFFLTGCATNHNRESPAAALIRHGYIALDRGDYDESASAFRKAVGYEPTNASAYRGMGLTYFAQKDNYRAEIFMRKALQLDPTLTDLWGFLGDIYLQKGDEAKAMEYFEKCPPNDPHYAELHWRLGKMFMERNEYELARAEFEKALTHENFWGGYWGMGMLSMRKGDYERALDWLMKARKRAENSETIMGLAQLFDAIGDYEKSYFYYTLAVNISEDPKVIEKASERRKNIQGKLTINGNGERILQFNLSSNSPVRAGIWEQSGKLVKNIFTGTLAKGKYQFNWDGRDNNGNQVGRGEYIGFVETAERIFLTKIIIQ